jgi:uncharacterized DUF497 family protein
MISLAKMHACACSEFVRYVWGGEKAAANLKKHRVDFADAVGVFDDEFALRREDPDAEGEERFVALGMDHVGRAVVVYTYREEIIRLISAREATKRERGQYAKARRENA